MKPFTSPSGNLGRILPFLLTLLLTFASYRPAIHLISLAALAAGEGGSGAHLSHPNNLPRPTRQQSKTDFVRVARVQKSNVGPGSRGTTCPAREGAYPRMPAADAKVCTSLFQPDYLRPFLPSLPYNHLSPPA